jgi:hypothetical protein
LTLPFGFETDERREAERDAESEATMGLEGVVEGKAQAGFEMCAVGAGRIVTIVERGLATAKVCRRGLDGGVSVLLEPCAATAGAGEALEDRRGCSSLPPLHTEDEEEVGGVG